MWLVSHKAGAGRLLSACLLGALSLGSIAPADATVVRFDTDLGVIDITLYDDVAPATVSNFLNYVVSGRYDGTFFHRSALKNGGDPFVIQGGGFTHDESSDAFPGIQTDPPVLNEYNLPNTRGTIALAKQGGDPNSGTSQFFFNTSDNTQVLNETNNGGFTVFGHVMGDGMDVVDAITALPRFNVRGGAFGEVPLEVDDPSNVVEPLSDALVFIKSATLLNLVEGDADLDGFVGQADLDAVLLNWGKTGSTWDTGDFSGNSMTDQADIEDAIVPNWGTLAEPPLRGTAVPEPAAGLVFAVLTLGALRRSR